MIASSVVFINCFYFMPLPPGNKSIHRVSFSTAVPHMRKQGSLVPPWPSVVGTRRAEAVLENCLVL